MFLVMSTNHVSISDTLTNAPVVGILTQLILTQALGAPLHNLSLPPPTSFVAMERYIGNMLISIIPCHMKILKNKKDILWKEF